MIKRNLSTIINGYLLSLSILFLIVGKIVNLDNVLFVNPAQGMDQEIQNFKRLFYLLIPSVVIASQLIAFATTSVIIKSYKKSTSQKNQLFVTGIIVLIFITSALVLYLKQPNSYKMLYVIPVVHIVYLFVALLVLIIILRIRYFVKKYDYTESP